MLSVEGSSLFELSLLTVELASLVGGSSLFAMKKVSLAEVSLLSMKLVSLVEVLLLLLLLFELMSRLWVGMFHYVATQEGTSRWSSRTNMKKI